ncbi:MAG: hypothetical protein ACU843_11950, partial [Gammaproteobacteria bacterium]
MALSQLPLNPRKAEPVFRVPPFERGAMPIGFCWLDSMKQTSLCFWIQIDGSHDGIRPTLAEPTYAQSTLK